MTTHGHDTLQGITPDGSPVYCEEIDGCPVYPVISIPPIIEINPDAVKLPPSMQDECEEEFGSYIPIPSQPEMHDNHAEPTTTENMDDEISRLVNAQPSTSAISSIIITLTKPADPWSTSSDSGEGTTFPWFTEWTTTSLVTKTITKTSTAEASTAKETTTAEETMSTSTSSETPSSTTPEATASPVPSKKQRPSGGKIAGIVLGVLGGIGLILLAFFAAIKFRHKFTKRRQPQSVYTTMNRASTRLGRRSPSYFDTASTPNASRSFLSALPSVFGKWRNNSPPTYSRPEVQSPEQPMYQAHAVDSRTMSSSVYSQNSQFERPPEIPRPYGNYI
ncbi:hypothetical protein ACHAPU_002449 [Fusarium lateritium]